MTEKFKESLRFVVKYYRPDSFRPDPELFRIEEVSRPWWRRTAVAASVAVGILAASAFIYIELNHKTGAPVEPTLQEQTVISVPEQPVAKEAPSKRIEFKNASLPEVAEAIAETYGVEVTGVRAGDTTKLTLSYEGTAEDLVETINELLGTKLGIVTKKDREAGE